MQSTEGAGLSRSDESVASEVDSLLDRLDLDPGDLCVVSLAAAPSVDGLHLVFGSVLFGPEALGQESWPEWAARTTWFDADQLERWREHGVDPSAWRHFGHEIEGWHFSRTVIEAADRGSGSCPLSWCS